ncbi:hypothetical protein HUJ05_008089 [Dendroctonus ponderosae]|nr:hypothetical protein HUJ05_008089 [Dendroctonus ponderosae]
MYICVLEIPGLQIAVPDGFSTASDVLLDATDDNFDLAQYLFSEGTPVAGDQSYVASRIEEAPSREPLNDGSEMQVDDFKIVQPKKHKRKRKKMRTDEQKTPFNANMRLAAPVKSLDLKARKYVVQMNDQSKNRDDEDEPDVDVETVFEGEHSAATLLALQISNDLRHKDGTESEKRPERTTNADKVSPDLRLELSSNKRRKVLTKSKPKGMKMKRLVQSTNLTRTAGYLRGMLDALVVKIRLPH